MGNMKENIMVECKYVYEIWEIYSMDDALLECLEHSCFCLLIPSLI